MSAPPARTDKLSASLSLRSLCFYRSPLNTQELTHSSPRYRRAVSGPAKRPSPVRSLSAAASMSAPRPTSLRRSYSASDLSSPRVETFPGGAALENYLDLGGTGLLERAKRAEAAQRAAEERSRRMYDFAVTVQEGWGKEKARRKKLEREKMQREGREPVQLAVRTSRLRQEMWGLLLQEKRELKNEVGWLVGALEAKEQERAEAVEDKEKAIAEKQMAIEERDRARRSEDRAYELLDVLHSQKASRSE
ncbi:hypothetical protein JCM8097_005584 [Rhodosporidiobolus ruineniae]